MLYIENPGSSAQLIIMNVTGQVVHASQTSETLTGIDVQHLPAGVYFITVSSS